MTPKRYSHYDPVDWASIYRRLHVVAARCTSRMPDIFDGISAEDLVTEALTAFFQSTDGLKWDPAQGPLAAFLVGVLRNKAVDHARRQARFAGSIDDPDFAKRLCLVQPTGAELVEQSELSKKAQQMARGDSELAELVIAMERVDGGHHINQQLAEQLRTTPEDIVNRRKRLVTKFKRNG